MTERHQVVQKCTPFDVGGGTEHCRPGESRFIAFHVHPFEMWTPSANFAFGIACSWSTRRPQDVNVVHHHRSKKVPLATTQEWSIWEKKWWKSSLWCGATTKPRKSRRGCSLIEECRATAHKWLNKPQVATPKSGLVIDFSN